VNTNFFPLGMTARRDLNSVLMTTRWTILTTAQRSALLLML